MNDIDLQIEQIESARQELKKHFGEYYELSALTHTIPLLQELKARREITDDIEKSNFNPKMLKACTDTSYDCGYYKGSTDAIDECVKSLGMVLDNENIKSELKHLFEQLKDSK